MHQRASTANPESCEEPAERTMISICLPSTPCKEKEKRISQRVYLSFLHSSSAALEQVLLWFIWRWNKQIIVFRGKYSHILRTKFVGLNVIQGDAHQLQPVLWLRAVPRESQLLQGPGVSGFSLGWWWLASFTFIILIGCWEVALLSSDSFQQQ